MFELLLFSFLSASNGSSLSIYSNTSSSRLLLCAIKNNQNSLDVLVAWCYCSGPSLAPSSTYRHLLPGHCNLFICGFFGSVGQGNLLRTQISMSHMG
jgi:hypothetical protein